jgi:hypothetical protein
MAAWLSGSHDSLYASIRDDHKVAFSAATIALAAGVLASRTLPPRAKAAILLFMLALLIANADFYWVYHARVTYALSVKLFATGLLIITLVCAEQALDGRASGVGLTAASWRDRRDTVLRKPSIFRACDLSNAADRRDDTRAADPG